MYNMLLRKGLAGNREVILIIIYNLLILSLSNTDKRLAKLHTVMYHKNQFYHGESEYF